MKLCIIDKSIKKLIGMEAVTFLIMHYKKHLYNFNAQLHEDLYVLLKLGEIHVVKIPWL